MVRFFHLYQMSGNRPHLEADNNRQENEKLVQRLLDSDPTRTREEVMNVITSFRRKQADNPSAVGMNFSKRVEDALNSLPVDQREDFSQKDRDELGTWATGLEAQIDEFKSRSAVKGGKVIQLNPRERQQDKKVS